MLGLGLGISRLSSLVGEALNALLAAVKARAATYENQAGTLTIIDELTSDELLDDATILTTPTAYSNAVLHSLKDGTSNSDFDVTSDTDATRINENGLLEDIAANQPRINYEPSASGVVANNAHILLEPTRTNLNPNSSSPELLQRGGSQPNNTTRVDGQTDPYGGTSASQFTRNAGTSGWFGSENMTSLTNGADYTHSIFVKLPSSNATSSIEINNVENSGQSRVKFVFSSESFTIEQNATGSFEKFPNGYYRISMTFTCSSAVTPPRAQTRHFLDDGKSLIVFGLQFEEGSFASSYIPTTSSSVTRTAGTIKGSGNTSLIDSTIGVLYAEFKSIDIGSSTFISLFNDPFNRVSIGVKGDKLFSEVKTSNVTEYQEASITGIDPHASYNKIAILYKAGDNNCKTFVNGVDKTTSHTGVVLPSGLDEIDLSTFLAFNGHIKCIAYFDSELNDTQLTNLTSRAFVYPSNAFAFTVKTDNTGTSNDDQFTIPISNKVVNATIYWGDDTTTTLTTADGQQSSITHTYPSAGTYNIYVVESATKGFSKIQFNNGGDKLKMINIANWGILDFEIANTFYGCSNMTCTATDVPVYAADGNHLASAFRNCTNFNGAIGNWDVSNCNSLERMLNGCTNFNQDLSSWDVSGVSTLKATLDSCSSFNQDLSSWDVSSVENFGSLFRNCTVFNQNIGSWNTSSATDMSSMFANTTVFNQSIDSWDVSSVTNMNKMFDNAIAFNQDISSWDFEGLTHSSALFRFIKNSGMSTANYSALLIRWAAQDVVDNLTVDSGSIQYSASAASARASLIADDSWTITDGGQA